MLRVMKKITHKIYVILIGGHRTCLERGCNNYCGISRIEEFLFTSKKIYEILGDDNV